MDLGDFVVVFPVNLKKKIKRVQCSFYPAAKSEILTMLDAPYMH